MRHFLWIAAIVVAVPVAAAAPAASPAPASATGELWEITSKTSFTHAPDGAKLLPPDVQRICSTRPWKRPPVIPDAAAKCEMFDFEDSEKSASWKVTCSGPPAMSGEGRLAHTGPGAYTGWMRMTGADERRVTVALKGRLLGSCDPSAPVPQPPAKKEEAPAATQGKGETAKAASCREAVLSMDLRLLQAQENTCGDPAYKTAFCERLGSTAGFGLLCGGAENDPASGLAAAASYCGKDATALESAGCERAFREESMDVLARCCPQRTEELVARVCTGRSQAEVVGSKYEALCARFGKGSAEPVPEEIPDPAAPPPPTAKKKTPPGA